MEEIEGLMCLVHTKDELLRLLMKHIRQAENGDLHVDWLWYPNGIHEQTAEKFQCGDDKQSLFNPITGSCKHFSLFDPFDEKTF